MAKSASGDKSAAGLPGVADKPNTARLWTPGHGDCSAGTSQGKAARLAEKAAGWRGTEQSLLGRQGRKGTFISSFGNVASPSPRGDGGWGSSAAEGKSCSRDQRFSFMRRFSIITSLNPCCTPEVVHFHKERTEVQSLLVGESHVTDLEVHRSIRRPVCVTPISRPS